MNKLFVIFLTTVLFLTSCGVQNVPTVDMPPNTETVPTVGTAAIENELRSAEHLVGYDGAGASGRYICDGGDVLYIVSQAYAHSVIAVYDKTTGTSAPLCNVTDCSHDEPKCAANISISHSELAYSDGKLYWLENDMDRDASKGLRVVCEDVKTQVRAVIKTIIPGDTFGCSSGAVFTDGKVIYHCHRSGIHDETEFTQIGIADLNGGEDIVIFSDPDNSLFGLTSSSSIAMSLDGGVLHCAASTDEGRKFFSYDMSTGELTMPFGEDAIPNIRNLGDISDDAFWFMTYDTCEICRYDADNGPIPLYDLSEYGDYYDFTDDPDGEIRFVAITDGLCCVLLMRHDGSVAAAAKDMSGNTVFETDVTDLVGETDGHFSMWIIGADGENVYCSFTFQDAGYNYQTDTLIAVPTDGGSPKFIYRNKSNLKRKW